MASLPADSRWTRRNLRLVLAISVIALLIIAFIGFYYVQTEGGSSALQTHVSITPATATSGEPVTVTIWDNNTLAKNNSVSIGSDWAVTGLTVFPCDRGWPIGIGLLRGHYVASNVSQGQLVDYSFQWNCPPPITLQNFTFLPHGSTALVMTNYGPTTRNILQMYTYQNLKPGAYTAVACDEWGHISIAYFAVT